METKSNISVGVVHGRFQPPHNGHVRYMLAALERARHVVIGVCTPTACTDAEAERTGYPCAPRQNPFTYEERTGMIEAALTEAGIARERYSFVPFPSDYQNIETLVPNGSVFLMSVTGAGDENKIAYLRSLGYEVETVFSVSEDAEREAGGGVRESARRPSDAWETLVPKSVAAYMKKHELIQKLTL